MAKASILAGNIIMHIIASKQPQPVTGLLLLFIFFNSRLFLLVPLKEEQET